MNAALFGGICAICLGSADFMGRISSRAIGHHNALLGMLEEGSGAGAAASDSGGKKEEAPAKKEPEPAPSGSEVDTVGMENARGRDSDMPPAPSAAKMMADNFMPPSMLWTEEDDDADEDG